MAEYITKEQVLETQCEKCPDYNCILPCHTHNAIKNLPTVDVVPVIHAKWERAGCSSLIDRYRCSNCHSEPCKKQIEEYKTWGWDFTDYCPHCGAKMDKGDLK